MFKLLVKVPIILPNLGKNHFLLYLVRLISQSLRINQKVSSANTLAARLQRNKGSIVINSAPPRPLEYHDIFPSASQLRTTPKHGITSSTCASSRPRANWTRKNGFRPPSSVSYSVNSDVANRVRHSVSATNLAGGSSSTSVSDVYTANESLVEQIQVGLGMDEEKYDAFRSISLEYRQGAIDISEYLFYAGQFGLSHLVLELARLCPVAQKQKEFIDAYNTGTGDVRKGKGRISNKVNDNTLSDKFLDTVKKLQLRNRSFIGYSWGKIQQLHLIFFAGMLILKHRRMEPLMALLKLYHFEVFGEELVHRDSLQTLVGMPEHHF